MSSANKRTCTTCNTEKYIIEFTPGRMSCKRCQNILRAQNKKKAYVKKGRSYFEKWTEEEKQELINKHEVEKISFAQLSREKNIPCNTLIRNYRKLPVQEMVNTGILLQ